MKILNNCISAPAFTKLFGFIKKGGVGSFNVAVKGSVHGLCLLGLSVSANVFAAAPNTFTDLISYQAAIPGGTAADNRLEDFSFIPANSFIGMARSEDVPATTPLTASDDLNGFNVARTGNVTGVVSGFSHDITQNSGFGGANVDCVGYNTSAPNGQNGICGNFTAGTINTTRRSVIFRPDPGTIALGFDFVDWNDGSQRTDFTITLSDGFTQTVTGPTNAANAPPQFFGLVLTQADQLAGVSITELKWEAITSELVAFWDVRTSSLLPQVNLQKTFGTIVNNSDGTFDIPITLDLTNSGGINLQNIELSDIVNDPSNFGTAYTPSTAAVTTSGILSGPTVSVTDDGTGTVPVAPTLDPAFDGGTNSEIFLANTGSLGALDSLTVEFTVRVDTFAAGAPALDSYANSAEASAEDFLGNTANDISGGAPNDAGTPSALPTLPASVTDVNVVKTASADPVTVGTPFDYVITVTDVVDTVDASNVLVTDNLDGTLTCNSVTASDSGTASACGASVTCLWASIPDGESRTCTINVTP